MTKRLQHIAPLQLGIVLATLYGAISLIFVPFILLFSVLAPHPQNSGGFFAGSIVFIVLIPILYAVVGFIGGVIVAAIYNLIAKFSGGIEFTLADVP